MRVVASGEIGEHRHQGEFFRCPSGTAFHDSDRIVNNFAIAARDAARERAKAKEKETNKWLREHERESQRCARSIMCFAEHIAKARGFSW